MRPFAIHGSPPGVARNDRQRRKGAEADHAASDGVGDSGRHAIEHVAIVHGDAGNFDGDCGSGGGTQLADGGGLGIEGEPLKRCARKPCTMSPNRRLSGRNGAWARSQGMRPVVSSRGRVAHHVDADRAGESGRADVERDEYGAALRVCDCGAVVEGGIFVALARLDDLKSLIRARAAPALRRVGRLHSRERRRRLARRDRFRRGRGLARRCSGRRSGLRGVVPVVSWQVPSEELSLSWQEFADWRELANWRAIWREEMGQ